MGIDVHKENWHVTVLVAGEELFHGRIPGDYAALRKLLQRFVECQIRVAYEAGPCGFGLHDRLQADGIEGLVVPPSLIPVESGNKVRTDRRDSRKLARLLESNLLKRVHVLTVEERAHRELLRTRRQLVQHRSDVARQIKSKLLFYSIRAPFSAQQQWTGPYLRWLKGLCWEDACLQVYLEVLLRLYEELTVQVKALERRIKVLAATAKYRERVRQGRITRCGSKRVRSCLVESAWILIGMDPQMRQRYLRIKARRGAKRAIIAVARTLSGRIRRMLLTHEPYVAAAEAA